MLGSSRETISGFSAGEPFASIVMALSVSSLYDKVGVTDGGGWLYIRAHPYLRVLPVCCGRVVENHMTHKRKRWNGKCEDDCTWEHRHLRESQRTRAQPHRLSLNVGMIDWLAVRRSLTKKKVLFFFMLCVWLSVPLHSLCFCSRARCFPLDLAFLSCLFLEDLFAVDLLILPSFREQCNQ